jgi:hypothetical protein
MLDAQRVVYLSLKSSIRADLVWNARESFCFHDVKNRLCLDYRQFAYAVFSVTTREVDRPPSFEIESRPPRRTPLQSVNAPTTESGHGAWRSKQLLSD